MILRTKISLSQSNIERNYLWRKISRTSFLGLQIFQNLDLWNCCILQHTHFKKQIHKSIRVCKRLYVDKNFVDIFYCDYVTAEKCEHMLWKTIWRNKLIQYRFDTCCVLLLFKFFSLLHLINIWTSNCMQFASTTRSNKKIGGGAKAPPVNRLCGPWIAEWTQWRLIKISRHVLSFIEMVIQGWPKSLCGGDCSETMHRTDFYLL